MQEKKKRKDEENFGRIGQKLKGWIAADKCQDVKSAKVKMKGKLQLYKT